MMGNYRKNNNIQGGFEIEDSIMTVTEEEKAVIETPLKRKRLNFFWFFIIFILIIILGRIFYLDVLRSGRYKELSQGNRIRSIVIKAPRGKIFDKFGQVLVKNVPSIDAVIIPIDLPETYEERKEISQKVSEILDIDEGNSEAQIESQNRKSAEPVLLKENITKEQALIVSENAEILKGISLENTATRNYENGTIFSSIIGYTGKITKEELEKNKNNYLMTDYIGKSGLEKFYENDLKGKNGAKLIEVDSMENVKKNLGTVNAQPGSELFLNVDEGLQKKLYDSLSEVLEKTGTRTAAAAAINPKNGGVLALVSLPSYDNNLFARGITNEEYKILSENKDLPLFNRVIAGEYPPGSTIKPAVAAAALSEGTINEETSLNCSGGINISSWHFGDWKVHGGGINVKKAIAESCDVFFYAVGGGYGNISGLGMDRMKKYENLFGFGNLTGIDLPGEADGLIPDEKWKSDKIGEKWYIGDSYHSAIGQGFITATPIQLANYAAALANGGKLYSPSLVGRIKKNGGSEEVVVPKIIRENFIAKNVLEIVRQGMRQTVTEGSARSLNDLPVAVAGKTGTAEFGGEDKTHAWFISFAPFEDPEIAMVVLVEGGGEGSSLAVPVTKEVYNWYFSRE